MGYALRISRAIKRSTTEVLDDHLERRQRGDIEGDLEHNYALKSFCCVNAVFLKGRDAAVRDSAKASADQLP